NNEVYLALIIAILGSTTIFVLIQKRFQKLQTHLNHVVNLILNNIFSVLSIAGLIAILIMSLSYLASSTYNPFIYYRF
ncbi:MAG: hypothetical protein K8R37_13330, partial [Bacteroidales bacterium]|nr:hypothetical protein [Bacteroidales bacterium]